MRLPLKTRLFIGISLAVIFVLVLSFLSYYTTVKEREGEYMINHTMEVKSKLRDISINTKDYTASIRTMRRYDNAANLYKDVTPETIRRNLDELASLVSDNSLQEQNTTSLKNQMEDLFKLWGSIDLNSTKTDSRLEQYYYNEETGRLSDVNALIRKMDAVETKLLNDRQVKTMRLLDFNTLANVGGTIFILLIVLILCYIINREFSQRIVAEKKLRDSFAELETVNQRTNNYNEVLHGAQALLAECQKTKDVPSFLDAVLRSIISFMHVPAAVIYTFDEEDPNILIPINGHGIDTTALKRINRSKLPVQEQDAKLGVMIVENIPAGFWQISTAIGSAQPGTLAYLLLKTQQQELGLIELGSFVSFDAKQMEYMQMITNAISVRLAAVTIEESRNSLLEQLQEKQEILINQQEELRLANDELTHQTQVLQASEEELRVQEEELKQINVELEEKNEALESAKEVLGIKAAELEVSGKYKSEFLANMSHELRTPLNSVLILASLLRDNKDQNLTTKQIEYSNIIHKSGSDLLKLINDILDLSKIESGKADLDVETFKLAGLEENMRQLFFVLAEQNEVEFVTEILPGVPESIHSDRQKLEQVLKNLLSNAFKFTPKKGTVSLTIKPDDSKERLLISVKDTGIGIPADKQAIVFEAFKQADGSTNRKYGGTGLGLSISRELAKLLGGSISLESREQQGSTFTLNIPVTLNTEKKESPEVTMVAPTLQLPLSLPVNNQEDGRNRTILIIEDDANFASILQTFAEERHYTTMLAFDGKEGLDAATRNRPDAIILDMQLPVMDGWAVLKQLKENPSLRNIPVHIISASDDVQVAATDAIAYLKKPVSKEALDQAFSVIGKKLQGDRQRLLIIKGATLDGDLLAKFTSSIPTQVPYDFANGFQQAVTMANEHRYGCVIADIGNDIDGGIAAIESLKSAQLFEETAVIIFIDKEISVADERKLNKVSEAVVMNSREAQRRLSDELDLFLHKIKEIKSTPALSVAADTFETDVLKGKTVLLADDDMRNVFALVSLLEEQKMEVVTAGNGREAVDILEAGNIPDIVLMDIMMPEMDGYEATQYLRNKLQLRSLPVIAITAKAMSEDRDLCLAAGASDYISKPVDTQKLLSLMRVWLSQ